MFHSWRQRAVLGSVVIFASLSVAQANPTEEDVFRSINQNVGSTVDVSKAIPYLLATVAIIILIALYNNYRKRQSYPRKLNHPGKLTKELCRSINLRSVELKQLKLLAEEQELEYPLTLILCPSVLGKAIRSPSVRVDRAVVKQVVQRLRQSLAGGETRNQKSE